MYCKHCGEQIDNDSTFCSTCGKQQKASDMGDYRSNNSLFSADSSEKHNNYIKILCPKCGSNRVQPESPTPVNNKRWQCLSCGNTFRTLQDAKSELQYFKNKSTLPILICSIILLVFALILDELDLSSGGYTYNSHYSSNGFSFSASSCDFLESLPFFCYFFAFLGFIGFIVSHFIKNKLISDLEAEVLRLEKEQKKSNTSTSHEAPTYCPNCDTKIYPNVHICPNCGQKF